MQNDRGNFVFKKIMAHTVETIENWKINFYSRCEHRESMNDNENLVGLHHGA